MDIKINRVTRVRRVIIVLMVIGVVRALRMSMDIRHIRVSYFILLLDDIGLHATNATSSTNLWLNPYNPKDK
jgi:hypothetical protein